MNSLSYSVSWADIVEFKISIDKNIWSANKLHEFLNASGVEERYRATSSGQPYFSLTDLIPIFLREIAEGIVPVIISYNDDINTVINELKKVKRLPLFDGSDGLHLESIDFYSFDDSDFSIEQV